MKKIISASFVAALAMTMLLPIARQVNASSVNHSVLRQGSGPMPTGGGGHFQGSGPMPTGGGGHFQGSGPMPTGGGGHFQGSGPMPTGGGGH
jgi:hypothetical protein